MHILLQWLVKKNFKRLVLGEKEKKRKKKTEQKIVISSCNSLNIFF